MANGGSGGVKHYMYQTRKETKMMRTNSRNKSLKKKTANTLKFGDTITFGSYPQSRDGRKAPIEWMVFGKKDHIIKLLSLHALDCKQFDCRDSREYEEYYFTHERSIDEDGTAWLSCSLRRWLNGYFFNNAFSLQEQKQIINPRSVEK